MASNLRILSAEVVVPDKGVASYNEMVEFVRDTLTSKTVIPVGKDSGEIAEGIVQSILNRLRIGF